jgi:hypothetical protein
MRRTRRGSVLAVMVQHEVTDPKVLGTSARVGDLINLEGVLGTYETVQDPSAAAASTTTAG